MSNDAISTDTVVYDGEEVVVVNFKAPTVAEGKDAACLGHRPRCESRISVLRILQYSIQSA
jgi:hypothetical protein